MRSMQASIWIVALSAAALLLGTWGLVGLFARPVRSAAPAPALTPQLAGAHGFRDDGTSAGPTGARPGPRQERDIQAALAHAVRATAARGGATGRPPAPSLPAAPSVPQAPTSAALASAAPASDATPLIDRLFAPERTRPGPLGSIAGGLLPPALASAFAMADPGRDDAQAPRRSGTERAYYQEFQAIGRKDADELRRRADAVIGGQAEDCMKVAMLRALYDAEPARATAYFVRAIRVLPDLPRPTGVSVPAFAVGFLCERTGDPAVRGVLEQLVWSGSGLSPALVRQAADALVASASAADLRRYGGCAVLQEAVAAADLKE